MYSINRYSSNPFQTNRTLIKIMVIIIGIIICRSLAYVLMIYKSYLPMSTHLRLVLV